MTCLILYPVKRVKRGCQWETSLTLLWTFNIYVNAQAILMLYYIWRLAALYLEITTITGFCYSAKSCQESYTSFYPCVSPNSPKQLANKQDVNELQIEEMKGKDISV